jgi:hypothetical protein
LSRPHDTAAEGSPLRAPRSLVAAVSPAIRESPRPPHSAVPGAGGPCAAAKPGSTEACSIVSQPASRRAILGQRDDDL